MGITRCDCLTFVQFCTSNPQTKLRESHQNSTTDCHWEYLHAHHTRIPGASFSADLVVLRFTFLSSPLLSAPPGPSTAIDTACSSSLLALENAFHAIRQGQCDAALVGGVNLLLKPNTSVQFMKLGMLSPEGTCKSFDASGEHYLAESGWSPWLHLVSCHFLPSLHI